MGRPYSTDLRERVLRACEVGAESQAAIARRFEISESAVGSWLRQLRQDGRREPRPHGRGFRSILDEDDGAVLRSLVAERNDATLAEYTRAFTARTGEEISESSICRALRRHGLVVKKRLCGRVSNGGRMSPPNAMTSARKLRRSIRTVWSSWMRVGS